MRVYLHEFETIGKYRGYGFVIYDYLGLNWDVRYIVKGNKRVSRIENLMQRKLTIAVYYFAGSRSFYEDDGVEIEISDKSYERILIHILKEKKLYTGVG